MRPLVLAAALFAVPAFAQSTEDVPPAPPAAEAVDPALIGAWQLDEVVEGGRLEALDVTVEGMDCAFAADGEARVEMALVQDRDPMTRARAFAFATQDGRIVVPGDDDVVYRLLADGRLELTTAGGLVVRLARADA